jgi:hypothetical protein
MLALTDNAQMLKQLVLCQHCCKRLRNVILLPCMHLLFCRKCVKELKRQHKEDAATNVSGNVSGSGNAAAKAQARGGQGAMAASASAAPAAAAKKQKSPFRCPKCSVEVRGKMKCEMGC